MAMGRVVAFFSGHTVYMAVDRFFEKYLEPLYRQKATDAGCANEFEQELIYMRSVEIAHASQRAFTVARRLGRLEHN